jgi:2-dehydro-3-deoxyphosphooctonate aldolase (KDO 8-P synthase)
MQPVRIGQIVFDAVSPPLLIAGPCVIEDEVSTIELAERIATLPTTQHFTFVFKASYLKDNRSAAQSYRGPGRGKGLEVLLKVKERVGCPVISDVHSPNEVPDAADVLDIVQIPAFMSRQTSLLEAAGACGRAVNIKKGQFLAPEGAKLSVDKVRNAGGKDILLTERGTTFGYNDLVVDFRSMARMKSFGCPVIFDVTHSLQRPGGLGDRSGGEPQLATTMARAAAAVPCDGFFIETHMNPSVAKSDAASMVPFSEFEALIDQARRIHSLAREISEKNRIAKD